jgi:hypothetical protein
MMSNKTLESNKVKKHSKKRFSPYQKQEEFLFIGLIAIVAILLSGILFELSSIQILLVEVPNAQVSSIAGGIAATVNVAKAVTIGVIVFLIMGIISFVMDIKRVAIVWVLLALIITLSLFYSITFKS